MEKTLIPLDEPYVDEKEIENLTQAIKNGWISALGPFVGELEKKFADYHGVKYACSCFSGTSALIIAMKTLKIGPGDEVIIPALTFSADAFAVSLAGAKIAFADCGPDRFTIDPKDVKNKITDKTKAIIPTHLYGRPAEIDELKQICQEKNIILMEDCAQAQGAEYKGKKVGSIGDFNIHSFHNKLIATGEGGMITTNDEKLAERFRLLMNPAPMNVTDFAEISTNQRMSNLHSAVGLAQLQRLEESVAKKLKMAKIYDEKFRDHPGIKVIPADDWSRTVYWRYTVVLDPKIDRAKVIEESKKIGFTTREAYLPLHKHPFYSEYNNQSLPNAEYMGKYALDIPSSVRLTEDQILTIADQLKEIVDKLNS